MLVPQTVLAAAAAWHPIFQPANLAAEVLVRHQLVPGAFAACCCLPVADPQGKATECVSKGPGVSCRVVCAGHYCEHFSTPEWAAALASIPFHFSWDDHDIFDGWGSYPDYLQKSAVFQV